jgi:hypothetical protein
MTSASTFRSVRRSAARRVLLGAAGLVVALSLAACEEPQPPPVTQFERAEELLRAGDYDGATRLYEAFLADHPRSPLARVARQRLRNIDRELEAVMGRRATPAPIYIRPEPTADDVSNGERR